MLVVNEQNRQQNLWLVALKVVIKCHTSRVDTVYIDRLKRNRKWRKRKARIEHFCIILRVIYSDKKNTESAASQLQPYSYMPLGRMNKRNKTQLKQNIKELRLKRKTKGGKKNVGRN